MKNIIIAIVSLMFLNGCSMWNHGKGSEDVICMFGCDKHICSSEHPDYLSIPIDKTYLNIVLKDDSTSDNLLFPIKVRSNGIITMIVTTIEFLHPLYCEQKGVITKKTFIDTIEDIILNKKCICLNLPTTEAIGKPFYHVVRNDDWVFDMVSREDCQVFFNYFFYICNDMGGMICYSDGLYKLGAVAEMMFYLKKPLRERHSCDGTYQWVDGNQIQIEKNVPNISKEMKEYLREVGGGWYVDGNIKQRRMQKMPKWW